MGEILAHGAFSFVSGVAVAVTGFGCDFTRELFAQLGADPAAHPASSPINMGLCAALVTAVQAVVQRRLVSRTLLINILPLTFIGVVLSLNVFSASALAALVPALGACLLGLCLAKLWMELADRRHKGSVRQADDDGSQEANSWKWTGVLAAASLAGGLLSRRCPPPGLAFMVVLLATRGGGMVGGGEWRATAALVTCSSSLLRVGLLLLENGASAGPLPEVSALVLGGLVGVGAGNLALHLLCKVGETDAELRRTPPPAAFRRCVLVVALASSVAAATGGPPAALALVAREVVLGVLVVVVVVAIAGGVWGCTKGAEKDGARGAYGTVATDDHDTEVELKPFAAGNGPNVRGVDDDYLDEEDGYLADEGETEQTRGRRAREQQGRGVGRVGFSLPAGRSPRGGREGEGGGVEGKEDGVRRAGAGPSGAVDTAEKKAKLEAPPAHSLFPAGHTMEL